MRKDQFYSTEGVIVKLPKRIGSDSNGAPIAIMHIEIKSYKGTMPVKFWQGLARQVLDKDIGLKIGDTVAVDGYLERRHYTVPTTGVVHDDAVLIADKCQLSATGIEYKEQQEVSMES